MMKLAMAKPGTGFFGDGINMAWATGRDASDVIEVSDEQSEWPFRLTQRFLNGTIVKAPADAAVTAGPPPFESRVMAGGSPEALAHMAIPAPESIQARAFVPAGPSAESVSAAPPDRTVRELRAAAKELGIPQSGSKAELKAAVEAAEEAAQEAGGGEAPASGAEPGSEETPAPADPEVTASDGGEAAEGASDGT